MRPLEGITVVSIEQAVAAPFATRQLADLGARVVKIERPGAGDFARGYDESVRSWSSYFVWLNRSKESLALDLKAPAAKEILDRLLAGADVFVQNLAPGAASRLGLGTAALNAAHPELVVCNVSGYGADGAWREHKAYDLLVQCESGLVSLTGEGEVVAKVGISIADIAAGTYAYSGVLTSLYTRATTGRAPAVEVSLFDALGEWMGQPANFTIHAGRQPDRVGVAHATIAPYGPYPSADGGSLVIGIQNEREWEAFCRIVLEEPGLASDPRFATNSARVAHRPAMNELIGARTSRLGAEELRALLDGVGIANARVNSVAEFVAHPAFAGRNRWREVETPVGPVPALLPPAVLEGVEPRMDPVPAVGAHSRSVLAGLGYDAAAIDALVSSGAVDDGGRR